MAVTVVVASRNRREELLASLPRHETPVVLVDNGSTDGSTEAVRRELPHVEVVELGRNLGSTARNEGVRRARTPYVAFADDDSWWEPGALARAAALLRAHPRVALLAGRVRVGTEERLDPMSADMAGAPLGHDPDLPGPHVLGFMACAAVVRRDAFLAVGGFDDVVFFAGEEERVALDLAAAGWVQIYAEDVVAHHVPSARRLPGGDRERLVVRNALLTTWARRPWPVVARRTAAALHGPAPARAGARDAVRRLPRALRMRRVVPPDVERAVRRLEAAGPRTGDPLPGRLAVTGGA